MKKIAPYGTWSSNITGNFVAEQSLRVGAPQLLKGATIWLESRPAEQGRQVIVMRDAEGQTHDILPKPWSARSRVHEYGGGAYTAAGNNIYFVNAQDQQIYVMDINEQQPKKITNTADCRYSDLSTNTQHSKLVAVCEQHQPEDNKEPLNYLVCINLKETSLPLKHDIKMDGITKHDFFSNPRFSPCGQWLSYITWDHPNMPWDNTQLWVLPTEAGSSPKLIAGNGNTKDEPSNNKRQRFVYQSIVQPQWSPSGDLFWVSDKNNWWNLYSITKGELSLAIEQKGQEERGQCIHCSEAEFATPQWVFGMSSYCFIKDDTIFASYTQNGKWYPLVLNKIDTQWKATKISSELIHLSELSAIPAKELTDDANGAEYKAVFLGATATSPTDLYTFKDNSITALSTQNPPSINDENKSVGQIITFSTSNDAKAHGVFYPPQNASYQGPENSKPPLIVFGHGGPTGACDTSFSYKIQFWTQRGFAVVDVNYRGSTGYGREFRHSLQTQWGVYDVADLAAAAEYLTEEGLVHPEQRVVRGGSAGGFTVLAALTDTNTFNAGCTLYGVADLETLALDTHKFESKYLDGLIGPYPQNKALYIERSPIHKVRNISCPILVFQGAEDKVVPPEQAEAIVNAAQTQGLPVAYVLYKNEGHGFRRGENIQHQAEAELYFYQQVLGLVNKTDCNAPITIENWNL